MFKRQEISQTDLPALFAPDAGGAIAGNLRQKDAAAAYILNFRNAPYTLVAFLPPAKSQFIDFACLTDFDQQLAGDLAPTLADRLQMSKELQKAGVPVESARAVAPIVPYGGAKFVVLPTSVRDWCLDFHDELASGVLPAFVEEDPIFRGIWGRPLEEFSVPSWFFPLTSYGDYSISERIALADAFLSASSRVRSELTSVDNKFMHEAFMSINLKLDDTPELAKLVSLRIEIVRYLGSALFRGELSRFLISLKSNENGGKLRTSIARNCQQYLDNLAVKLPVINQIFLNYRN